MATTNEVAMEKGWKLTIKATDGTSSEVMLPPIPGKSPLHADIQEIDLPPPKVTRRVTAYLITQHTLTAMFSLAIIAVMALTLQKHQSTQMVDGAWPQDAYLTPTLVMLTMAIITCTADIVMVVVQCLTGDRAERAKLLASRIRTVGGILQALSSAAGAGFLKYAENNSNGNDLWSWTCSNAADQHASVNAAGTLCSGNQGAWILSLLQVALQVLSVVIPLFALWKPGEKNDLKKNVHEAIETYQQKEKMVSGAEQGVNQDNTP